MMTVPRLFRFWLLSLLVLLGACDWNTATTVPVITSQPVSATTSGSTAVKFTVVATGNGLSYQWYQDNAAVSGGTTASLTTGTAGSYYVVVSNSLGKVTSNTVTLKVTLDPVVTVQPVSATITAGNSAVLSVVATGTGLSYQWYRGGAAISGATNANYSTSQADSYYVVVTSSLAGAKPVTSSTVSVTISSSPLAPTLTTQPSSLVVATGGAASFSVLASGTDLTYQWYKSGFAISAATRASLDLNPVAVADAGSYYVIVKNSLGSVVSNTVSLTVTASGTASQAAVVSALANAFLDTLTASQKIMAVNAADSSTVQFANARTNAMAWSGYYGARHGLRLNSAALSATQLAAANALINAALSSSGATQVSEIRLSDDVIATTMPSLGAGAGQYSLAFVGAPSATQAWTLQITGHHLAHNLSFNTAYASGTPQLLGAQPPNWTFGSGGSYLLNNSSSGTQHAPMEAQRLAVSAVATVVQGNTTTAAAAKLASGMSDLMFGPTTSGDSRFKTLSYPSVASERGALVSTLSAAGQAAVKAMIEAWVKTQTAEVADALLTAYESDTAMAATYVAYAPGSGGTADFSAFPNASASPLTATNSYLRIDGPRVWIEFLVKSDSTQTGVLANTVFYQSIWRDKLADYGGQY